MASEQKRRVPVEWTKTQIGLQATLQRGFDITKRAQRPGKIPVISSSGVSSYHDTAAAKAPGVILGRKGVVGSVHFISEDYWPHDTTLWVKDFHGNDPRFVYYFFKAMARQLAGMDVGSANPSLNRNHVHPIQALWPPIREQREIAASLAVLDDRIALLACVNESMEAIARTIFKSWFVDFDPVRAKVERREPENMDAATAALFPDRFQKSRLGMIPDGWSIRKVEEFAEKVAMGPFGSSIRVETFVPSGIPVISGNHLRTFILEDRAYNFISEEHAAKLARASVSPGDIVFTHAGNIGNFSIIPPHSKYSRYIVSQRQFFLTCDRSQISPNYVVLYFSSAEGKRKLLANSSSVGVPSIARPVTYLRSIELLVPEKRVLARFDEIIGSIFNSIEQHRQLIETLAELRDTLLPRLISGKLRAPEAEKLVEAMV